MTIFPDDSGSLSEDDPDAEPGPSAEGPTVDPAVDPGAEPATEPPVDPEAPLIEPTDP
ncbi:hypothetical protein [Aeromicrobium sp. P5_D10]